MFYSNNDSYLQDLYFYNQMPHSQYISGTPNNMLGNYNMQQVQGGMMGNGQMFMNSPCFPNNNMPVQNLNNLYPSIYRILNPVVSKVTTNTNQPITEELLNNMTDTVFNIVEGQIDLPSEDMQNNENQSNLTSNASSNSSQNRNSEISRQNSQNTQTSKTRCNSNDSLLKDLIKILIIKELLFKNQHQRSNIGNNVNGPYINTNNPIGYMPYYNNLNI